MPVHSRPRFVNMSNVVLWFTYTKAFFNTLLARAGFKAMTFKVCCVCVCASGGPWMCLGLPWVAASQTSLGSPALGMLWLYCLGSTKYANELQQCHPAPSIPRR